MSQSHEVDYEIIGEGMQMLVVELDPGESVIAEAGAMNFMEEGINFESKLGDGSDPEQGFFGKMFSAGVRMVTGESLFMTHFCNEGHGKSHVGFAAPYPGAVVPVDMGEIGGELVCQKDSFLCAALGTRVSVTFSRRIGAGLFGGEGFILQKLEGDGMAFMHAGGAVMKKELRGETLRVDTGCLVGFTPGVDYSIERAGGLKSMMFGGEGLFVATLSGTGTVWLQSLPFSRLADRILACAPTVGGTDKGEE
jgi:uncharacterized protein (TIGR00266 family)